MAADQLGTVTGVGNNAGATLHIGDLADTPVRLIRQVIDVDRRSRRSLSAWPKNWPS
jgi:hypothetical protein